MVAYKLCPICAKLVARRDVNKHYAGNMSKHSWFDWQAIFSSPVRIYL